MIISTTNIASTATITATPDSSLQDINVISDGDFSSTYTDALAGSVQLEYEFPGNTDVGYLAIAGSNIGRKTSLKITSSDTTEPVNYITLPSDQFVTSGGLNFVVSFTQTITDVSLSLSESPVLMYKVDLVNVRSITITVEGAGQISISEIAMGDYYEVTRGEQGGYKKAWSVPNIASRSGLTLQNTPVNLNYESRALTVTLSEPNNIMADFAGWYSMINFAANNTFYILEDDDPTHAYACFNARPTMTASHSQTRKLGVSGITFSAFAKSSEALF